MRQPWLMRLYQPRLIACATEYFDTPLIGLVRGHTNLVGYMDRMKDRYFAKNLWPVPEMA